MPKAAFAPPLFLLTAFAQAADVQLLPLVFPELSERWPLSENPGPALLVAYALGAAVIPISFAQAFPRVPTRPLTAGSLALLGVLAFAFASPLPFEIALLVRALAGGVSGILSYAALSAASTCGGFAIPALTVGFLLAFVLGPAAGGFLADQVSLSAPWLWLGPLCLGLSLGVLVLLPTGAQGSLKPRVAQSFWALGRDPVLRGGLVSSVLIAAAVAGPIALFPSALADQEAANLDLKGRALVYLLAGLGTLLALPLTKPITERFGVTKLARLGAFALTLVLLFFPPATAALWSAASILGLALAIETIRRSALQALIAALPAEGDRARYLTLRSLSVQLGIAGGVMAASALEKSAGMFTVIALAGALALASIGFIPKAR